MYLFLGALRVAHIGVALTDAEASLVSPFSTSRPSLFTVGEIIKSGRSCLATNVATTMWFVIYGLTFCTSKLFIEGALKTKIQFFQFSIDAFKIASSNVVACFVLNCGPDSVLKAEARELDCRARSLPNCTAPLIALRL